LDKKKNVLSKGPITEPLNQSNIKVEKFKWMKAETIYQSLNKVLSSKLIESHNNQLTSREVEFWNSFKKYWRGAEILPSFRDHQKALSSDLIPNILDMINEEKYKWEIDFNYLFEAVENYLKNCCCELTELYDGTEYSKSIFIFDKYQLKEVCRSSSNY